jgi:phenol 2-monooxygenase (NADPH)
VLIPREGGYLVRFYVDLGDLDPNDRDARSRFTLEHIIASAQEILAPYTLDVRDVAWWSVYEVGQRVADRFDNVLPEARGSVIPRVFIAGDACHTHSAKAGQGMNVSMQDGFNLGWKLAAVLRGQASPELLDTYNGERQPIAQELIDFDTKWSSAMAEKPRDPEHPELGGMDAAERQEIFQQGGRFTAGLATVYPPNLLTGEATHQDLATGFPIGERFYSAPVVRVADAKPVQLGHEARADGRWRLYAFADAAPLDSADSRLAALCSYFETGTSREHDDAAHPGGSASDSLLGSVDFRAVLQQPHREVDVTALPAALKPLTGKFGLVDYEKVYSPNLRSGRDTFAERGIDRQQGALVIVRPDQYVSHVLPLDASEELEAFFARFSA